VAPVAAMPAAAPVAAAQQAAAVQTTTTTTTAETASAGVAAAARTMPPEVASLRAELQRTQADVSEIKALLKAAIAQGQGGEPAPQPQAAQTQAPNLGGMARCVACHTSSTSATKGGGFAILADDGRRLPLDERAEQRIDRRVRSGSMPPAADAGGHPIPRLTAAELQDILGRQRAIPQTK
jgi:hypothetical protein